jgi:hypothetical protein
LRKIEHQEIIELLSLEAVYKDGVLLMLHINMACAVTTGPSLAILPKRLDVLGVRWSWM